jgi:hypothetical protein
MIDAGKKATDNEPATAKQISFLKSITMGAIKEDSYTNMTKGHATKLISTYSEKFGLNKSKSGGKGKGGPGDAKKGANDGAPTPPPGAGAANATAISPLTFM